MLNSCLSLFTNMRSKSERRLLGQGFWSNLFYYLHINYAVAVLFFYSAWLIVFVFQKVGWNVFGVKCLRGEMSLGWNVFGVKCLWGEMYRGEMPWGEMSSGWNVPKRQMRVKWIAYNIVSRCISSSTSFIAQLCIETLRISKVSMHNWTMKLVLLEMHR